MTPDDLLKRLADDRNQLAAMFAEERRELLKIIETQQTILTKQSQLIVLITERITELLNKGDDSDSWWRGGD